MWWSVRRIDRPSVSTYGRPHGSSKAVKSTFVGCTQARACVLCFIYLIHTSTPGAGSDLTGGGAMSRLPAAAGGAAPFPSASSSSRARFMPLSVYGLWGGGPGRETVGGVVQRKEGGGPGRTMSAITSDLIGAIRRRAPALAKPVQYQSMLPGSNLSIYSRGGSIVCGGSPLVLLLDVERRRGAVVVFA